MKRYCVSFMKWAVFAEYVEAESEDGAEAQAREQLERRNDADPAHSGIDLIGAQEDDDE